MTVIDTATSSVRSTIPVGKNPQGVAAAPDGSKLYVSDHDDQAVSVVDPVAGTLTSTIPGRPGPQEVTMNSAGTEAYVVNQGDSSVSMIDTGTDTISATVSVGANTQHVALYDGTAGQCPCSIFPAWSAPTTADSGDPYGVVLGVKVSPSASGRIEGVRFYKSAANSGTHTGSFWTSDGTLLATGTFTGETATGWQTLMFANPVAVKAGGTYIASYYAPNGHYAYDTGYFINDPAGRAPITALADSAGGGNGVYSYNSASAFPAYTYNAVNYWVDVVFDGANVPTSPPDVTGTSPTAGASGAASTTAVSATFSAPMDASTTRFTVTDAAGTQVPGAVSYNAARTVATFTPGTELPFGTVFTASIQGADGWGNAMTDPVKWTFTTGTNPPPYTCPCSLFDKSATPAVEDSTDPNPVEVGIRFTPKVNGTITGVRFYKGALDTGVHTGTLWNDSTGAALATGTFSNETATGWQTLTFATPVRVTAGTTYVASYHAPVGRYAYTNGYFTYPYLNYPLAVPAGPGSKGNGLYAYGSLSTFPNSVSSGTNYWVDAVFNAS
ncbi:DUF4082 domain-containing protein [Catenulispora yoronensis]